MLLRWELYVTLTIPLEAEVHKFVTWTARGS